MNSSPRQPTDIDAIAEQHFDRMLRLSPIAMTNLGINERQDEYDDFSPAGLAEEHAVIADTLRQLRQLEPVDLVDKVTKAAMLERLGVDAQLHLAHERSPVNGIVSGLHDIRMVYDMMPTGSDEDWQTIARRLRNVPVTIDGWFESVADAAAHGVLPATRQVRLLIEQCESWVSDRNFFDTLGATSTDRELSDATRAELSTAISVARQGFADAATRLTDEVLPLATEVDGVGQQRYQLHSRQYLGATIDLAETYVWGLDEVARISQLMLETADRIQPGASVKEAIAILDADDSYALHGTDALREWMQTTADAAIEELSGSAFDIDPAIARIECMIAPTTDGGIYYTGPSEDLSRPGRMWWSVPPGVQRFTTWRELTTVYHEGVPGHHLQIAQTMVLSQVLNRWRRMGCWVSGHGEGWALYSEWLMAELGHLDDPGNRMGMLDSQALRAVRVVIDLGVHCGFEAPGEVGGGEWTFEKAWDYFNSHVSMEPNMARYELNRYFGWPGQAPSYKIGQRLWEELRDRLADLEGDNFDLASFHRRALNVGSVGLDVLRAAVLDGATASS